VSLVCDHTRCGWKPWEEPEPAKSDFLRCQCDHYQVNHRPVTKGGCRNCSCDGFKLKTEEPERRSLTAACACSHVNNWHVRADHSDTHCAATGCPCEAFRASSEDEEPRCEGCGHPGHSGFCRELEMPGSPGDVDECGCLDDSEPPLTPEEEEEAAEDPTLPPPEGPEYDKCACGAVRARHVNAEGACYGEDCDCFQFRPKADDPPPPQPERRPPYAVAYSVSGHLFEVALPGDATVRAVDGALVIQHHLGPVAGIVSVLPIINKES
jgi:hypothetical protein